MRATLDLIRVAIALALALALTFAWPSKTSAEVAMRATVSPAAPLGLEVGRPIEIALPDGSRVRGMVLEVSDLAAVVEYRSASGVVERQTIAFAAMQTVPVPPKVDRFLDKYKWFFIIPIAVAATFVLVMMAAAGGQ